MALGYRAKRQCGPHAGGPGLYAEILCLASIVGLHGIFFYYYLDELLTLKNEVFT